MDQQGFEKAVTTHKDRVFSYATMILRNATEAQDVAQEAMVRLWQRRDQVEARSARSWMLRTVHNLCIDRIRKSRVRSEVGDGETVLDHQTTVDPGPEQLAQSSELGRTLDRALGRLTARDRAVVVLREVQGLPYDEIAEALEMPLGTLKATLHRARERLRGHLSRAGVTP